MDIEKETTGQQRTATGQQDKVETRRSGKIGEYTENPIAQKDQPTEQQATQPMLGVSEVGGAWGDNHQKPRQKSIAG